MQRVIHGIVCTILLIGTGAALHAQDVKGFRGDLLGQIGYKQKQVTDLLNSIPDEKMTWRPGSGVRSVSEVYLHIAYSNYFFGNLVGVPLPDGMKAVSEEEGDVWEKSTTDKKEMNSRLAKSFDFLKAGIAKLPDARLEETVDFFGQTMTVRGILLVLHSHIAEHLGQSIAYARMVGVVPPWTAAQQAAQKEAQKAKE